MASSASPGFHDSEQPGPHGGLAHQREDKDPLSSLNFLKTLSEKKKARGMTDFFSFDDAVLALTCARRKAAEAPGTQTG